MTLFIALGDLHGHLESLNGLTVLQKRYPDAMTIFIGDYIDSFIENNGFKLLRKIREIQQSAPTKTIVLMGNHEQVASNFFKDPNNDDWLYFGGNDTLMAENNNNQHLKNSYQIRNYLLRSDYELINWMTKLPLTHVFGKLCFVHAGLNLNLDDPLTDTSDSDRVWLRAKYWYAPTSWGTFNRNKMPFSIITGHTPSGKIAGDYGEKSIVAKMGSERNSIYAIQYPNEMPRYLIDGGVGEHDPRLLGNIGVFDSKSGLLVDAIEDF